MIIKYFFSVLKNNFINLGLVLILLMNNLFFLVSVLKVLLNVDLREFFVLNKRWKFVLIFVNIIGVKYVL